MDYFTKKEQLVIMFLILVIIIISLFSFLKKDKLNSSSADLNNSVNPEDLLKEIKKDAEETEEGSPIMVHISGEVYKPGLVELGLGSRVVDAVELAGGLKKDADMDRINLAKKLLDEEKIYIPKIGEENAPVEISLELESGDSQKININTATKEQLMTLPGIGEVLAGRIVDYRENTSFNNIEDIKNVSGIGDKKFEGIQDLIITR